MTALHDPAHAPRRMDDGYKGDAWTVDVPPDGDHPIVLLDTGVDSVCIVRIPDAAWERAARPSSVHAHDGYDETVLVTRGSGTLLHGPSPDRLEAVRIEAPVVIQIAAGWWHGVAMDPGVRAIATCFYTVPGTVIEEFSVQMQIIARARVRFADLAEPHPVPVHAEDLGDRVSTHWAFAQDPGLRTGEVEDGRGRLLLGAPTVEIDVDQIAELVLSLLCGVGGRAPGDIGTRHRHRTGLAQQLDRHGLQRHPHHHGASGIAEVPLQRRSLLDHQAQRPRPEGADQFPGAFRHRVHQALDGVPGADEDTDRHVPAAAFGLQQCRHRRGIEGVGAQSVDSVRR